MESKIEISKLRLKYLFILSDLQKEKRQFESVLSQIESVKMNLEALDKNPMAVLEHEKFMGRIWNDFEKKEASKNNKLMVI